MVKKIPWHVYQAVFHGLIAGRSTVWLAGEVGVGRRTISRWVRLAGMSLRNGRDGGAVLADMDRVPGDDTRRSYRRLTLADRSFIQAALSLPEPLSARRIAAEIGMSPSTISREIARHSVPYWGEDKYDADLAHYRAQRSGTRPGPRKLDDPVLRTAVVSGLNQKHSPQQVAHRLRVEFPDDPEMHVSHETIYQALYVQGKGALRHELTVEKALRSGRTGRKPQSRLPKRSSRPWLDGARLSERPAEAEDRAVPGHWEGDLVVGPRGSGIVTLVERSTRFCLVGRLPGVRDSQTVIEVMQQLVAHLPGELLRSITWDQGSEMARHRSFTEATGCRVFFCDPHSPWQRGSNENLNGLIRDFFAKGTDFTLVTDAEIADMQRLLNDRPRKTLEWGTPREKLTELITGVALAI